MKMNLSRCDIFDEVFLDDMKDVRANYDDKFCAFVKRIIRECDPKDDGIWVYWDSEYDDGTPCLHAGHFYWDEIIVEYYNGLTEETLDGNSIPSGYIHIDCSIMGKTPGGLEWFWGPSSGLLTMGENAAGEAEYMDIPYSLLPEDTRDELIAVYTWEDFLRDTDAAL